MYQNNHYYSDHHNNHSFSAIQQRSIYSRNNQEASNIGYGLKAHQKSRLNQEIQLPSIYNLYDSELDNHRSTNSSSNLKVAKSKYTTSLDPRGYVPVYEYTVNNQPILWDRDDHYVYWTGIWKALGRDKSEIIKLIENDQTFASNMRRIRGGYLKIQGTWLSFKLARKLAIRTCYSIRYELCILFGPDFKSEAIPYNHHQFMHAPINSSSIKLFKRELSTTNNSSRAFGKEFFEVQKSIDVVDSLFPKRKRKVLIERRMESDQKSVYDCKDLMLQKVNENMAEDIELSSTASFLSSSTTTDKNHGFMLNRYLKQDPPTKTYKHTLTKTVTLKKNPKIDECCKEFLENKASLKDAILVSLCLQKLSSNSCSNSATRVSRKTTKSTNEFLDENIYPPLNFRIGNVEFRYNYISGTYQKWK